MKLMDLPIYELTLSDTEDGLTCMGLVDDPAIEQNWIMMENHKPIQFTADKARQILFGPAMIPDQPIYRRDNSGEYYVVFSQKTIEEMVEKWSRDGLTNAVNLMHDHDLFTDQCTLVEMFTKNASRGLNPTAYEDLPDGTLFVAYKVQKPLWDMIVSGDVDLKGFSIEAVMSYHRKTDEEMTADEILNDEDLKKKSVKQSNIVYYTVGELTDMMEANKVYEIKYYDKTYTAQIYAITDNGAGIEIMTADKVEGKNTWHNLQIGEIESIKETNAPYLPWETETKSFSDFINSNHTVTRTIVAPPTTIDEMIKQHSIVMINYNDSQPNPHTSTRQCAIIARGLTYKGNSCIRVFQFFGDSRSIAEGYAERPLGDYRLLLEKRITQMRLVPFANPWTEDELDISLLNTSGDDGMETVYTHYSDFQ
jgi:hypothetical protein